MVADAARAPEAWLVQATSQTTCRRRLVACGAVAHLCPPGSVQVLGSVRSTRVVVAPGTRHSRCVVPPVVGGVASAEVPSRCGQC